MTDFAGKVVLVTGSSARIAEAALIAFAQLGAQVIVTGRDVERVKLYANQCNQVSATKCMALEVVVDIKEDRACKGLVDVVKETFRRLDVLVNTDVDDLDKTSLTRLAIPLLIESNGAVINVISDKSGISLVEKQFINQDGLYNDLSKSSRRAQSVDEAIFAITSLALTECTFETPNLELTTPVVNGSGQATAVTRV